MEEEEIHVPIPSFPIFKLRSSLIDKDPLIWVHMLEAYVKLIKLLLDRTQRERKLSVKSQQQLQAFLRAYLAETAQEENRIFSLGAVNPDIKKNSAILRTYIFQLIKDYSIVKLNLTGEATWNFILVYSKGNCTIVRSIVDGTHKSHFNNNKKSGNIDSIEPVQRHILKMITDTKFKENDLEALSYLLGQNVHSSKSSSSASFSVRTVSKVKPSALAFAESFVTKNWINSLEEVFTSEGNAHSDTAKQVMIVSLLSLSIAKVASLATKLGITNAGSLKLCPLFSAIITSDGYKRLAPGLEERMVFLKSVKFSEERSFGEEDAYTENDINLLLELFPQLNKGKAITLLRENNGNVEATSNRIFEDPNLIPQTAETTLNTQEKPNKYISDDKKVNVPKRSIYDGDKIGNLDFSDHSVIYGKRTLPDVNKHAPNELKNRTLDAALRIIYESDEDEPDDTYVDQEPTEGLGAMDNPSAGPSKEKLPVYDDDKKKTRSSEPESYLFAIYKEKGSSSFERSQRKSPGRQALKKDTKWSDEQIEGWYRMLLRSPKRFRMLEDDYLYNFRRRK